MNVAQLAVQTQILLATGDRAEVMAIDEAAGSVRVRYLDAMGEPELVNTEAWISGDEVIAIDMGTHSEGPT